MECVQKQLFAMRDERYRDFSSALMPNIDKETVIGVRTPALRKLAKEFAKEAQAAEFMRSLPHAYYEENNLHACLIEQIRDFDACIAALDVFLPYVDNWATCDMMAPKVLKCDLPRLLCEIRRWIDSGETYTIRFGMKLLMTYFLDAEFSPEYLEWIAVVHSNEYYVNMMQAWYFATALAKQYAAAIVYLEEKRLPQWVHNKTIQKAVESYRITPEQKAYLRTLKIK